MEYTTTTGRSVVTKLTLWIGTLVMAVVLAVIMVLVFSNQVNSNISKLKIQDMEFQKNVQNAYQAFLTADDQANMWVGLYHYNNPSLASATLQQVLSARTDLMKSLRALTPLTTGPQETQLISKTLHDAQWYDGFLTQVKQENQTNHSQAEYVMYIGNADASNALTTDLQYLVKDAQQRVEGNAAQSMNASAAEMWTVSSGGLFVIVLGTLTLWYVRKLMKPLPRIAGAVDQIAAGDLTVEALTVHSQDEIGRLTESTNKMVANLRHILDQVNHNAQQVAASAEQLTAVAEENTKATEHVARIVQETAEGTDRQTKMSAESTKAIQTVANSIVEIGSSSDVMLGSAEDASQRVSSGNSMVHSAVSKMTDIQTIVTQLSTIIHALGERSKEIGSISQTITQISQQTNLLALNAAIESARAGEFGRGFAVVADEVRKLAEQSARSAEQISQIVMNVQSETGEAVRSMDLCVTQVEDGTKLVTEAGDSFHVIQRAVGTVQDQIQKISEAIRGISSGSNQLQEVIHAMDAVTETTAVNMQTATASAEEQLASMQEVSASASALSEMADGLHQLVIQFKL